MPLGLSPKVPGAGGGGIGSIFHPGVNDGDLVKRLGNKLDKVTGISELLIVDAHTLATFTNTSGNHEFGETVTAFDLNWTYNRNTDNPTSQTIDNGIGAVAVALRTLALSGLSLVASTTYTISAIGDDTNPSSLSTTVPFYWKRYYGVSSADVLDGADVMSILNPQFSEYGTARAVSKTFDASAGTPPNYLYYAYPAAWGAIAASTFNGFGFTDYSYSDGSSFGHATPTALTLTNASGGTTDYYIVRTNNQYSGAGLTWSIT